MPGRDRRPQPFDLPGSGFLSKIPWMKPLAGRVRTGLDMNDSFHGTPYPTVMSVLQIGVLSGRRKPSSHDAPRACRISTQTTLHREMAARLTTSLLRA